MQADPSTFGIAGGRAVDLPRTFAELERLPVVLRILLENSLRCRPQSKPLQHFADWLLRARSDVEIEFSPGRLLMHDTTCGPALVDIAGMRDALAEMGGDPRWLNPELPIDVSTDHSIAIDSYGSKESLGLNMAREATRNSERFLLTKWAEQALTNFRVHPPGTGILHTINLEQLATVVVADAISGGWIRPDTLIGTDSHTPMINGLGVLGWGVGGLEAEGVMFGMPVVMQLPEVIGVKLTGQLPEGTLATDLALRVTELLRHEEVGSAFVEFFGPGVSSLTVGDRAVVANMAPEFGAQTAYFPVDDRSLTYLRDTGRTSVSIELVEAYCRRNGLWFDPEARPVYTRIAELDLSTVRVSIAGPRRPHDRLSPADAPKALAQMSRGKPEIAYARGHGSIAIASITSCTNTTDPQLTIAAGLLARRARERGLSTAPWVKTAFSPGSPAAALYLERVGLLADLEALGFSIVGYGCMACIGNTGPLDPYMDQAVDEGLVATAIISGNRNFPGRVHPRIEAGFLASPPMVVAYAIAGTAAIDILSDSLGEDWNGEPVFLKDLWPSSHDIEEALHQAHNAGDFAEAFKHATNSKTWSELKASDGACFPWTETSTYLRRPPFTRPGQPERIGSYDAFPLIVLGDDITTDHISPAGPIDPDSETGRYLVSQGENASDLNVHASRRGNFESMVRGLFTNKTVDNQLMPGLLPGLTIHAPTCEIVPLYIAAQRYTEEGQSSVVFAGKRYGQGSSRDWAAKGLALLGVRAVFASSFERIHRTNLIGMGILPLRLPDGLNVEQLDLRATDQIQIDASFLNLMDDGQIPVSVTRGGQCLRAFIARAEVKTDLERQQLKCGGVVPLILARTLEQAPQEMASSR